MPTLEELTRISLLATPQQIKECAAKEIDIKKCERDILSKDYNIRKYISGL